MSIVIQSNQIYGSTGADLSVSSGIPVRGITMVADIKKALADLSAAGTAFVQGTDSLQIKLMTIPTGAYFVGIDAVITEALVITGSPTTDLGFDSADPDDYVDAQSNTAVGRFTSYVSGVVTPTIVTTAQTLYLEFNGTLITSGKVAVTVWVGMPAKENIARAVTKAYTNA